MTGVPPTRVEIARSLGFRSANAAEDYLRALARHGAVELTRGRSRGIRLRSWGIRLVEYGANGESGDGALERSGTGGDEAGLPVIGRVAAGSPILAAEHVEYRYRISPRLFRPRADYLLRVRGSSMRDAGILDGDLRAIHATQDIHATQEAENGRIVVARLNNKVTVKRLRRLAHCVYRVQLLAENPGFPPIAVDLRKQELVIEGVAVGVLRLGLVAPQHKTVPDNG